MRELARSLALDDTASVSSSSTGVGTYKSNAGVSHMTQIMFNDCIRFPNSMSKLLQIRCYLLASQVHNIDFTKYTDKIAPKGLYRTVITVFNLLRTRGFPRVEHHIIINVPSKLVVT
jgi:hypothetical protein